MQPGWRSYVGAALALQEEREPERDVTPVRRVEVGCRADALPHSVVGGVNSLQASLVLLTAGEESPLRVPFRKGRLPLEALTQVGVAMPLCFDL